MAGLAYVVTEYEVILALNGQDMVPSRRAWMARRAQSMAQHWAKVRDLPFSTPEERIMAVADAARYREEHAEVVDEYLAEHERRQQEREANTRE
jgi:hypothetical protein